MQNSAEVHMKGMEDESETQAEITANHAVCARSLFRSLREVCRIMGRRIQLLMQTIESSIETSQSPMAC